MKIVGKIEISNRLLPSLNIAGKGRSQWSSLSIGKQHGRGGDDESELFIFLQSAKDKMGTKYKVGRIVPQKWVFGIYGVQESRAIIVYVDNRNFDTLMPKIVQFVKPGTELWTDKWAAYRSVSIWGGASPYTHKTVNHSQNFVDPLTGVCTNAVESYWSKFKRYMRKRGVLASELLPQHIDEFMWMEMFGRNGREAFRNMVQHIRERYPVG